MLKKYCLFLTVIFICFGVFFRVSAHPGRTDSKGGHWDRSNGTYHYHSGEYAGKSSSYNLLSDEQELPPVTSHHIFDAIKNISHPSQTFLYSFAIIVFVFILLYVIITRKHVKDDISIFKEKNEKIFSLDHIIFSWYFLYGVVFFLVVFVSILKKNSVLDIYNNIIVSAITSLLIPPVIALVFLIFAYLNDKEENRVLAQNGCTVERAPEVKVTYQEKSTSYTSKHPFWPFFYMYTFYMLLLLVAVWGSGSIIGYSFNKNFVEFLSLFFHCTLGFIELPLMFLLPAVAFTLLTSKCIKIENASKVLVCKNCYHRNSLIQNHCEKCGIDFQTYNNVKISSLKMMDKCCINSIYDVNPQHIDEVASDTNYSFFSYNLSNYGKGCLLRVDKKTNDIVFFGDNFQFNCIFQKHLFSADIYGESNKKHFVLERDINSGKSVHNFWFSPGTVNIYNCLCQDSVKNMYVNEDKLIIEVHRKKSISFPSEYEKYLTSRYNATTDYLITVIYKDGKFEIIKTFPKLDKNYMRLK